MVATNLLILKQIFKFTTRFFDYLLRFVNLVKVMMAVLYK